MTEAEFFETMEAADPVPSQRVVNFTVPGVPVAKGRPKFARRGKHITTYTPAKTAAYEILVQISAEDAMKADPRLCMGPLRVDLDVVVPVPSSWSKTRQRAAMDGNIAPTTRGDLDNYGKAVLDGMNGYVFNDDSQVVKLSMSKRYGEPAVHVIVTELPMEAA